MTQDLGQLDAVELAQATDGLADVVAGLGIRVTVAGLSLGGVAAAWAGQGRGARRARALGEVLRLGFAVDAEAAAP